MARVSYRAVLSLCLANKSVSKVAKSLVTSPKTVRRIRDKATEMGLLPDKWKRYRDEELHTIMNLRPNARKYESGPDWENIHEELGKKETASSSNNHMTIQFFF